MVGSFSVFIFIHHLLLLLSWVYFSLLLSSGIYTSRRDGKSIWRLILATGVVTVLLMAILLAHYVACEEEVLSSGILWCRVLEAGFDIGFICFPQAGDGFLLAELH